MKTKRGYDRFLILVFREKPGLTNGSRTLLIQKLPKWLTHSGSLLFDGFVRCSQTMCGWLIRSEDKIRQPLALHTLAAQATLAGCSNPPELL